MSNKKAVDKGPELFAEYPNLYDGISKSDLLACMAFAEDYKSFLNKSKTEREFTANSIEAASQLGFVDIESKKRLKAGDKVYASIKDKGLILAVIGKKGVSEGFNILGAHVDSPRLDLKPNPVFEDSETVYFKTHYYGGIKKYQWTTIPLALHGVIYTSDGVAHNITIGEDENDPIFYITDLLPHLDKDQMKKSASEFIPGEHLNIVVGGIPLKSKNSDGSREPYKAAVLTYLNKKYGIVEKDFVTGELEVVPAVKARDVGFDRAYIAGYGHDDKVCAYPALMALLEQEKPEKTCVTMLTDKEEIGSYSNSGAQSVLYENFLMEIVAKLGDGSLDMLKFRKVIAASKMLSTDVTTGYDPKYASAFEKRNTAFMSHGIKFEKYTGGRGKSGSSEATGDFVAQVARVLNKNNIAWQTGELGRIDVGGGGTISAYMAKYGMSVLDAGVPVWSMHAPYEVVSKIDLYYTYLAYKAFIEQI